MSIRQPALRHSPAMISLIREAIRKGDGFRLRLFGISMHPYIQAGDVARVRPVEWQALRPGQVALFERGGRLIAHRVLRVPDSPDAVLVAKGDTMRREDPPVRSEQLLGLLVELERRGRVIRLDSAVRRVWSALMVRITYPYAALFYRWVLLRRGLVRLLTGLAWYRARRRRRPAPIEYRSGTLDDALQLSGLLCDIDVRRGFEEVEAETERELREVLQAGGEVLVAQHGRIIVGCLLAVPEAEGWRLERLYVHSVSRGMGIGEALLRRFTRDETEAPRRLAVDLPPGAAAARRLLLKLGYRETGEPKGRFVSPAPLSAMEEPDPSGRIEAMAPEHAAAQPASLRPRDNGLAGTDAR